MSAWPATLERSKQRGPGDTCLRRQCAGSDWQTERQRKKTGRCGFRSRLHPRLWSGCPSLFWKPPNLCFNSPEQEHMSFCGGSVYIYFYIICNWFVKDVCTHTHVQTFHPPKSWNLLLRDFYRYPSVHGSGHAGLPCLKTMKEIKVLNAHTGYTYKHQLEYVYIYTYLSVGR